MPFGLALLRGNVTLSALEHMHNEEERLKGILDLYLYVQKTCTIRKNG